MGKFQVVEWKIENISFWRQDVHSEYIQSPDFIFLHYENADFYPRGIGGCHERMAVCLIAFESWSSGELSFIGSDGLPLCNTQKVKGTGESVLEDGPEFDQVVWKVKRGGDDHLILRFSFMSGYDHVQRMCTTINVSKVSLKIDPKFIRNVESEHNPHRDLEQLELKAVCTDGTVKLVFHRGGGIEDNIWVESRVCLQNSDNSLSRYAKKEHVFRNNEPWTFSDSLNVGELVEKGFTLLVDVKIANGTLSNSYNHLLYYSKGVTIETVTSNRSDDSTTVLRSDFKGLYRDQDFHDFTLKCDNVSFPVHKNILSARSPVFKSMLSTDMKEAASNEVDIGDLDPSTLGLFLTYLYTGAVEDLQCDVALKLHYAAHKYNVPSLKQECSNFLSGNVSFSNVCDVLTLAHQHQEGVLLSTVRDFIRNNFDEVSSSEEWKKFVEREPLLAAETWSSLSAGVGKIDIKSSESGQSSSLFSTWPIPW